MLSYPVLYFAYGSNLDAQNWRAWCGKRGYDAGSIEALGPAWLPDYELVFHYQSRLRRGGALDIRPRVGASIPGALFRVHDWEGLDAKEGVSGGYYRRIAATALTSDGRAHSVTTYRVCDARIGAFVPPGREYREMVTRGLSRFGHTPEGFLAAASGAETEPAPRLIFTYGTLMRGERNHDLLAPHVRAELGEARVGGASLLQVDWYPGLVLDDRGAVHGELYEVEDVATALQALDEYEDFLGYAHDDSLYRRSLMTAVAGDLAVLAWTYVFLGEREAFTQHSSGRWTGA